MTIFTFVFMWLHIVLSNLCDLMNYEGSSNDLWNISGSPIPVRGRDQIMQKEERCSRVVWSVNTSLLKTMNSPALFVMWRTDMRNQAIWSTCELRFIVISGQYLFSVSRHVDIIMYCGLICWKSHKKPVSVVFLSGKVFLREQGRQQNNFGWMLSYST